MKADKPVVAPVLELQNLYCNSLADLYTWEARQRLGENINALGPWPMGFVLGERVRAPKEDQCGKAPLNCTPKFDMDDVNVGQILISRL